MPEGCQLKEFSSSGNLNIQFTALLCTVFPSGINAAVINAKRIPFQAGAAFRLPKTE